MTEATGIKPKWGYGDQAKVGLRPAELGVYVDEEAVFEATPDDQEAFQIV